MGNCGSGIAATHLGRPRGGGGGGEESRPGGESPDSRHGGPALPGFLTHQPVARPRRPRGGAVPGHGAGRSSSRTSSWNRRTPTRCPRRSASTPSWCAPRTSGVDIAAPAVVALPVHLAGHGGPGVREAAPLGETRVLSATAIGGARQPESELVVDDLRFHPAVAAGRLKLPWMLQPLAAPRRRRFSAFPPSPPLLGGGFNIRDLMGRRSLAGGGPGSRMRPRRRPALYWRFCDGPRRDAPFIHPKRRARR